MREDERVMWVKIYKRETSRLRGHFLLFGHIYTRFDTFEVTYLIDNMTILINYDNEVESINA